MSELFVYNRDLAVPVHPAERAQPSHDRASTTRPESARLRLDRAGNWFVRPTLPAAGGDWLFRSIRPQGLHNETGAKDDAALRTRPDARKPEPRAGQVLRDAVPSSRGITALELYVDHFGLAERPFSLVPDPDFLFWSTQHQHAFAMLEYGILTRAPITLITGEIGAGKTTLIHHLIRSIDDDVQVGLISNTRGAPDEMLRWILMALGQRTAPDTSYPDLVAAFQAHVAGQHARGRRVALIFDEAQNLDRAALEELRMLTNINANKDVLLQLVLVGQPELQDAVHRPDLLQFAQRIASSYHLTAMDRATVRDYIAHRLLVAGATKALFSQAAVDLIAEASGGIPRRVNQLCDLAMVYAFTAGQPSILRMTVQQVLDDGTFLVSSSSGSDLVPVQ